jgi:hypothetical protein
MGHPPAHAAVPTTGPSAARPLGLVDVPGDRLDGRDGQRLTEALNGADPRVAGRPFVAIPVDASSTDAFVLLVVDQCTGEIDAFGPLDARATLEELEWLRQDLDHGVLANVSFGVVRLQSLSGWTYR